MSDDCEECAELHGECRDCSIERLVAASCCPECGNAIWRFQYRHAASCSRRMRRVAVVGTRPPKPGAPPEHVAMWARIHQSVVDFVLALPRDVVLVSGGANGVDSIAEDAFKRRGLGDQVCVHLPRPEEHGGSFGRAAFARNAEIEDDADECHAWPSPWGKGTQNTIKLFRGAGKPCVVHEP